MEEIDREIMLEIRQGRAMLVEGFTAPDYALIVSRFQKYNAGQESPLSLNFLEFMTRNYGAIRKRLSKIKNLFVYNIDLFGNGVNPDKATPGMCVLRATLNEAGFNAEGMTQLMFAQPLANLDYNSRKGYTYHDNHPLGNWCDFYSVNNGKLVHSHSPIQHRV